MSRFHIPFVLFFLCSAVLVAGCSSEAKRHKVTGTVNYKGSPIKEGSVSFTPEAANTGTVGGAPVKDGRFEIPAANGLTAGKYKVAFSYPDPKGRASAESGDAPGVSGEAKELLPTKYTTQTELRAEVKSEGPNEFTFDLK